MKIAYSWKRNPPASIVGESITLTITYSSYDKGEVDDLEKTLPSGVILMDTRKDGDGDG